ncbi:hypothetical protein [Pedobacter agri]|uniref:hypothetical protein n=1 Tax=Pedobacter agri TaxID=454586 RepID=UPI00292D459A|nr:hypothetical protein [Pedobacter agri]
MGDSIMTTLYSVGSIISPLIVFIACAYYVSKQVKADSILMLIGSGMSLLLTGFYSFLMPYFMQSRGLSVTETTSYYTIAGIISFFSGICFAVGLFILINNTVNANKSFPHQFPPNEFK